MRRLSSASHPDPTRRRQTAVMSRLVKVFLVLALVVPVSAYVAGSLAASSADEPADHTPVIIQDAVPGDSGTDSPTTDATPTNGDDRDDDRDDDSPSVDKNQPTVVTPKPTPVDDDDDDERDDRERDDDSRDDD